MRKAFKEMYKVDIPKEYEFHDLTNSLQCITFQCEMKDKLYHALFLKNDFAVLSPTLSLRAPGHISKKIIERKINKEKHRIYKLLLIPYDPIHQITYIPTYIPNPHSLRLVEKKPQAKSN